MNFYMALWKGTSEKMDFTNKTSYDYDSLKKRIILFIENNLSEKRLKHTYSVVTEAVKLAVEYGEDRKKAELAALFHDMFRGASKEASNMYVRHLGLDKKYVDNTNLAHGKIAAEIMKKDYGIKDKDILNAVSYHTTGRAGMSRLEKIIFLADAIEPGRNYPSVEEIREIAYRDLDKACVMSLKRNIEYIHEKGGFLDTDTIHARNDLKEKLNL